ncbi:MAG: hypothetical protein KDA51_09535, partial [Planctomycetales bacterium]|nr:hypothetical protein [Planctomycetales bacterium]
YWPMQARAIQHDCEYRRRVAELETELARLRQAEKRVGELEEHASKQAAQLAALQRHVFGRKSEKLRTCTT